MAKRLATLAALLAVLLVGATARTSVTTVEIDEDENQWRTRGGCSQQIQQQDQLRHCQEFLLEQARGGSEYGPRGRWGGSQYGPGGSQYGPRGSQYHPGGRQYGPGGSQYGPGGGQFVPRRGGSGSQQLDLCCNQLRQLDDQCRCEGLRQIVRRQQQQQQEQGRFRGQEVEQIARQEVEQIARVARNLPQQCGVGPQYCNIRALFI